MTDASVNGWRVSRSIEIEAPTSTIFDVLADPRRHPHFDGSGSVKAVIAGPGRLRLGARFGMRMHLAVPYAVPNRVVEFTEDRVIAWRHVFAHIWRYELEELPGGGTRVTETFDYSRAQGKPVYHALRWPERNAVSIEATLRRLKKLVEAG